MIGSGPRIIELDNPIRDYPWGSTTAIPQLLGREPDGRPAAELWIGAHPDSPSRAVAHADQPGLDALIAQDPDRLLGAASVARFGPRLPFLLKVLAADRALSLQVHPDAVQAEHGYAAEQAAGMSADDPRRNYTDAHHKPEMAYALTELQAFCGFRPVTGTVRLLDALAVPELSAYRERLAGPDGLRRVFTELLTLDAPERAVLLDAVLAGCRRLAGTDGEWAPEAAASLLAAADHPGDLGPVLVLLLNYVRLAPGEAIFLGAGNVHAYLRGVCVELLANSDNVLRCGLTGKHVDVPELVRIADFSPLPEPRWQPSASAGQRVEFDVPVPDFRLLVCRGEVELPGGQPYLVLAGEQPVTLAGDGSTEELRPWHAAFVAAGDGTCSVRTEGRVFVATVGADR